MDGKAGGDGDTGADLGELVRAAGKGDGLAWERLTRRFNALLWFITRSYGLQPSDAADVVQITWLRLLEHISGIHDPERIGVWLATTARRECSRLWKQMGRDVPGLDPSWLDKELSDRGTRAPDAEEAMLAAERRAAVRRALHRLTDKCQALLLMLTLEPRRSYEEIGAALDMPVGSIGPTRQRCLARLRKELEEEGMDDS